MVQQLIIRAVSADQDCESGVEIDRTRIQTTKKKSGMNLKKNRLWILTDDITTPILFSLYLKIIKKNVFTFYNFICFVS